MPPIRFGVSRAIALIAVLAGSALLAWPQAAAGRMEDNALPAPDYTSAKAWAALPDAPGAAAATLPGTGTPHPGEVAVFFIHPTTDLRFITGNAAFDATADGDTMTLKMQASVFNQCCQIYAPRYRQTTVYAITANTAAAYAADDLAYSDVARAFEVFLARIGSRPFIIAAHSQGSIHALRLLQDKIINTPLQRRLVAAYPVGLALPREIERLGLPICRTAEQTGCVVTWNSVAAGHDDPRRRNRAVIWWDGRYQPIAGRPLVCVNPLNWQLDGTAAADANTGAIYSTGAAQPLPPPAPHATGAVCHNGLLEVSIAPELSRHYRDALALTGIYHVSDYGLYYLNIQANAAQRIAAWERQHG